MVSQKEWGNVLLGKGKGQTLQRRLGKKPGYLEMKEHVQTVRTDKVVAMRSWQAHR